MIRLSEALLQKETLDLKAILEILGDRPFPSKANFKAYLETKASMDAEQATAWFFVIFKKKCLYNITMTI